MRIVMILALVSAPLAVFAEQPPEAKVFLDAQYRSTATTSTMSIHPAQ
jgi:hypothetical protein